MKLDPTSIRIMEKLIEDGRVTHQALAKELNYSRPAIHQRIDNLEDSGLIKGYEAQIDYGKLGFNLETFILVNIHTLDYNTCIDEISKLSEEGIYVKNIYRITGEKCIILKLYAASTDHLRKFHDKILDLEGLIETNTMLVMQKVNNKLKDEYIGRDAKK